ncbi:MAG: glycoside hydrolase family 19 protein, partial [candidate division WOR-3 bacterium]
MAELRIKRRVCIRSGPGEDYSVLCWLNEGDTVESPDTEGWVPVLLEDEEGENLVGWVEAWNVEEKKEEEDAVAEIVKECLRQGVSQPEQIAYVVATAEWETGKTFKPVKEAFWLSEEWRKKNLRYYPYYGRGYVQLTWESNYRKYSKILGIDLVGNPDL